MKKLYLFSSLFIIALLFFVSCEKDEAVIEVVTEPVYRISNQSFTVDENVRYQHVVGAIIAPPDLENPVFSFSHDLRNFAFALSADGALTVRDRDQLNHEQVTSFSTQILLESSNFEDQIVDLVVGLNDVNEIPTEGVKAYYPSDHDMNDISGNDYHGNSQGTFQYVADRNDNATSAFHIEGGHVDLSSHVTSFNNMNEWTISAWIKPDQIDVDGSNVIISKVSPGRDFVLRLVNGGRLDAHIYANGSYYFCRSENLDVVNGTWQHVIATYDGTEMDLFVNGLELNQDEPASLPPIGWNGQLMTIGNLHGTTDEHFWGAMDEIMILDQALDNLEIHRWYEEMTIAD